MTIRARPKLLARAAALRSAALLAIAVTLGGCASDRTGAVVGPTPPARPQQDVRDHAALVKAFGGEYAAPALKELVAETMARLRPREGGEPTAVTLLDSPKVNAFALPSGRLYVTRGLLALATDTSELAAVLSHEMAHLTRGHAAQRSEIEARGVLISRVAADVLGDREAGRAIRDRSALSLASFSRQQELEADALGIATLAEAGFDASAAPRFLKALGRQAELAADDPVGNTGAAGGLSTHPATRERVSRAVAAARKIGGAGPRREERERYLAALEGVAYGDQPSDGLVRGRLFLHPRLGIAFTAPDGMSLENTSRAVLGATRDGRLRLLFDAVDAPAGQSLAELLGASWADTLREGSTRTVLVGGRPVALAASEGKEWSFRLAAVRVGPTIFRLILAGRTGTATLDRDFDATLAGLREIGPDEAATLRPQRIVSVAAGPEDTAETLARRMATDRPLDRFRVLNGIEDGAAVRPGWRYKLVVD